MCNQTGRDKAYRDAVMRQPAFRQLGEHEQRMILDMAYLYRTTAWRLAKTNGELSTAALKVHAQAARFANRYTQGQRCLGYRKARARILKQAERLRITGETLGQRLRGAAIAYKLQ